MEESGNKMKKWRLRVYLVFMAVSLKFSTGQEVKGGIVNGEAVGRCVAGFCLPIKYSKLDPPSMETANSVKITTDIMDILTVS